MTDKTESGPAPLPEINQITPAAIPRALKAGLRDFLRAPLFGLFFSAVYVGGGVVLYLVFGAGGQEWWLIPFILGFPLLAPFAAIGLYEVSRRIEAGAGGLVMGLLFGAQRFLDGGFHGASGKGFSRGRICAARRPARGRVRRRPRAWRDLHRDLRSTANRAACGRHPVLPETRGKARRARSRCG